MHISHGRATFRERKRERDRGRGREEWEKERVALHIRDSTFTHRDHMHAYMHAYMRSMYARERWYTKPRMNRLIRNSVPRRARGMFVDRGLPERALEKEYDACVRVCGASDGGGYKRIAESTPCPPPTRVGTRGISMNASRCAARGGARTWAEHRTCESEVHA